jgi:hypothetical protein
MHSLKATTACGLIVDEKTDKSDCENALDSVAEHIVRPITSSWLAE